MAGAAKLAWDVLSGGGGGGDQNSMECFVRGGKSLCDALSGVAKMAGDVLSRDVLSYIQSRTN